MNNKNVQNTLFNYFLNNMSYVKTILDILPESEVSTEKKAYILEICNHIFASLNKEELMDVMKVSSMYQDKIALESREDVIIEAKYIYKNFLYKMLLDSYNREMYFQVLNECIKLSSGYYQEYNDNRFYQVNDNAVSNIRMR